jgi:hypothetical protein
MKIHIFYCHYNISGTDNKSRPNWFDYEKCFVNLLNTTKNKNVDIHVVMDGKIEDNWIKKYKDRYIAHEIITTHDMDSITKGLMSVVKETKCENTDLIYILENDYLHTDDWVDKILDIFQTFNGLNYVSLYDHNDKYFLPMYEDLVSKIFVSNTHHWRTTPSTCGSYIVPKKIFSEDYDDHTGVTVPIGDHHKWLWLNENKGRFVLTPIPGLSTHCMEFLMSPTIDWKKINNDISNNTNI